MVGATLSGEAQQVSGKHARATYELARILRLQPHARPGSAQRHPSAVGRQPALPTSSIPSPRLPFSIAGDLVPLAAAASAAESSGSCTGQAEVRGADVLAQCSTASVASAADMERSTASCADSYSLASMGRSSVAAPADGDDQAVQRSDGSLLSWVRPVRRPVQRSFSAARRGSTAASSTSGPSHDAGDAPSTATANSVHSIVRSSKLTPAVARSRPAAATADVVSTAAMAAPVASFTAGTHSADLLSSVLSWRQRAGGSDANDASEAAAGGAANARVPSFTWHQLNAGMQDAAPGVAPDSESLLQWRLPTRAASSRRAAALAIAPPCPQPPSTSPALAPAAPMSLHRIGSASIRRTFSSLKQKIFGADAPSEAQQAKEAAPLQEQEQQPGSPVWSIAAVRDGTVVPAALPQQQQGAEPQVMLGREPADGHGPAAAQPAMLCSPSWPPAEPESLDSTAEKLSRLKRLSELRRVSSAPITALLRRQQQQERPAAESHAGQQAAGGALTPATSTVSSVFEAAAAADSRGEGSPCGRPSLQALKVRARTARLVSSSSAIPAALCDAAGSTGSQYSLEAVEDVFGPDQPMPSVAALWSPLQPGHVQTAAASQARWVQSRGDA